MRAWASSTSSRSENHSHSSRRAWRDARAVATGVMLACSVILSGCGYHFAGAPEDTPFPPGIKTIVIESARNNTTISGIETELTNTLRQEFALGTRLKPVRSGGDAVLKTFISSYQELPSTYTADGKELTRRGTLSVACALEQSGDGKMLWKKKFESVHNYNVTDSIAETLTNRRQAISRMIKELIPRIHRSMYEDF